MAAGGGAPDLPGSLCDGFYVQPTVLDATRPTTCAVAQEEIFGPVAVVVPFDDEDGRRREGEQTTGSVSVPGLWTRDVARGAPRRRPHHRRDGLGERPPPARASLPWGGVKESGTGGDAGTESFDDFTWVKTVVVRTAADDADWYGSAAPGRLN